MSECICERCGRDYPVWYAPSDLWNLAVNRTQEQGDEWHFLCPTCFIRLHEIATGSVNAWLVTLDCGGPVDRADQIKFASGAAA